VRIRRAGRVWNWWFSSEFRSRPFPFRGFPFVMVGWGMVIDGLPCDFLLIGGVGRYRKY